MIRSNQHLPWIKRVVGMNAFFFLKFRIRLSELQLRHLAADQPEAKLTSHAHARVKSHAQTRQESCDVHLNSSNITGLSATSNDPLDVSYNLDAIPSWPAVYGSVTVECRPKPFHDLRTMKSSSHTQICLHPHLRAQLCCTYHCSMR